MCGTGDWGYNDEWRSDHIHAAGDHGWKNDWRRETRIVNGECQGVLASMMKQEAARLAETAAPLRFVVNAGDNFYPTGVTGVNDPVWESEWGRVYRGLPEGLPWYSVYGNHV